MARAQPKLRTRSQAQKQALKEKTKNAERYSVKKEGRRRDFAHDIEFDNAATPGRSDEPIPTAPNSRSAVADRRRAAEKGAGVMSLSKKADPDIKLAGVRETRSRMSARIDGLKTSRGAKSVDKALDKGSAKAPPRAVGPAPLRRTKSNAEIAEAVATTALKSPAPRTARRSLAATAARLAPKTTDKRTGGARQRVPAPGNIVSTPKGELIGRKAAPLARNQYVTSSEGGRKPPKRPARAGQSSGASKSKGADRGLES
jgi:hypothetical protein